MPDLELGSGVLDAPRFRRGGVRVRAMNSFLRRVEAATANPKNHGIATLRLSCGHKVFRKLAFGKPYFRAECEICRMESQRPKHPHLPPARGSA